SIQLDDNLQTLQTNEYYGYMLLQSSQFDKLNNIIQISKTINTSYWYGTIYRLEIEMLIENSEYESAENILGLYLLYLLYVYFFISFLFFKFYFYRKYFCSFWKLFIM